MTLAGIAPTASVSDPLVRTSQSGHHQSNLPTTHRQFPLIVLIALYYKPGGIAGDALLSLAYRPQWKGSSNTNHLYGAFYSERIFYSLPDCHWVAGHQED